jgi:hypothetical protein
VANEAPHCAIPLTSRAAAPCLSLKHLNRRRHVWSFTTSTVGNLLTKGSSSLVEAHAHLAIGGPISLLKEITRLVVTSG